MIDQAQANIQQNIQNAQDLFQSKLNQIFSQQGEGWEEKPLDEVCKIRPPKSEVDEYLNENDLISFVPMKCLGVDEMYFKSDGLKELNKVSSSYTYFRNNDVLLAKITPCFENGKLGIAKDLENGTGFGSSEYVVFRVIEKLLKPEFLYHFLNRQIFRDNGKNVMTGAVGHKRIPKDYYQKCLIVVPNLEEQERIIELLDRFLKNRNELIQKYKFKLSNLKELKKSLLQKAFNGELTANRTLEEVL